MPMVAPLRLSTFLQQLTSEWLAAMINLFATQLRDKMSLDYGIPYENPLLNAASEKLTRPPKGAFRMQ
jgi:hypothetical protein